MDSKGKSLAMAMSIAKNKRKKMASGGLVSAKTESRPMPDSRPSDTAMVKPAQMPSTTPLSSPKIMGSDTFSVRRRDDTAPTRGMQEQPPSIEEDDDYMAPPEDESMADQFADGGMIDDEMSEEKHSSIAAAIMARRKMADGGMVDIEENSEEQSNMYDKLNGNAALKENYDDDLTDVSQPMDSNEMGDEREESTSNRRSMVSQIRAKMRSMR